MNKNIDLTIYSDGGSRGNPGEAAYGFVVYDNNNSLIYSEGKRIGITTNNVAEYMGILKALEWVKNNIHKKNLVIECRLDSQLVASQLAGIYKIKQEHLRNLYLLAKSHERELESTVTYKAIRREFNKEADKMVNLALDGMI